MFRTCLFALLSVLVALATVDASPAAAQEDEFTEEYLSDPAHIQLGQELWKQQCTKCHGASSYPGKAPKLKPKQLTAREIYLKTTYGFGKMPAWEDVFSDEERRAITAFMKSDIFAP